MSHPLDETASRLLAVLEEGLPVTSRPYAEVAARAGSTEAVALQTLRALKDSRMIRRLGAQFSLAGLGYHAALGGLAVSEERAEEAAEIVGALPNVTHVFELDDRYRLWYVLAAPSRTRLDIIEAELARSAGAVDRYRVLPDELYKATVAFDTDGVPEPPDGFDTITGPSLDRDERALVRLLQGELMLVERPFAVLVETLGECGFDIDERCALERIQSLQDSGALRRICVTPHEREEPWRVALIVWHAPYDPAATGDLVASFPEVLHVFERRIPGGMAILAVIEGMTRSDIDRSIERIRIAGELDAPRIAYPLREYSRSPMRYFTEGD